MQDVIKTLSFAAVHMCIAFAVGYLMTGSIAIGSALALIEPLVNSFAYFFHEKIWERFQRLQPAAAKPGLMRPAPAN